MKILIISLPRTGSSSLSYDLAIKHNLKEVFEPFDKFAKDVYCLDENNIVLKTLIFHKSNSFYCELVKEFDTVILLSRRDLNAITESWSYLKHNQKENGFMSLEKYQWEETPNLQKEKENVIKWNNDMNELSKLLNIDITYYEDIFDENSNERYRIKNIKNIKSLL